MLFILGRPLGKPEIQVSPIKNGRKVVIVIAEGSSDEEALYPFLKELGKPHNVKFAITHGDVLSDSKNTRKSQKTLIGGIVSTIIKENKFLKEDILLVAQLTDTDGVFIDEEKVVIDNAVEGMEYRDFEIAVHNKGKHEDILTRNKLKSSKVKDLTEILLVLLHLPR